MSIRIDPLNDPIYVPNTASTSQNKSESKKIDVSIPAMQKDVALPGSVKGNVLNDNFSSLKIEKESLDALIAHAASLDSSKAVLIQDIVRKNSAVFVEKILSPSYVDKILEENTSAQLFDQSTSLDFQLYIPEPQLDIGQQLEPMILEEGIVKLMPEAEIAAVVGNILSRASVVFASGVLLNQIDEVIKSKENSLSLATGDAKIRLENEIKTLSKWLVLQTTLFNKSLKENVIMSTLSVPKALCAIGAIATEPLGPILTGAALYATSFLDWIAAGAGMIRAAINLHTATKDVVQHGKWTSVMANGGDAQAIVNKQRDIYKQRLELALRKDGIDFPEFTGPTGLEDLQAHLHKLGIKEKYNEMMQKKEVLSVSLRNALRTFSNKKNTIDQGFLSLALTKARGIFTATVVFGTLAIALKILVLSGAIAASSAMAATGFGVLAVLLSFMVIGTIYLYVKKPNIFKTYIRGVQFKLAFWSIPLAVQKFRLNSAILDVKKISENVNELGMRLLEVENILSKGTVSQMHDYVQKNLISDKKMEKLENERAILEKHHSELLVKKGLKTTEADALTQKMMELNDSVSNFDIKVKELQNQIDEAGWQDFQKLLLDKNEKIEIIKGESLLEEATLIEEVETQKILKYMEVNVENLKTLESDSQKIEIAKAKREFFAMDNADVMAKHLLEDATLEDDSETKKILKHLNIEISHLKHLDPKVLKEETAKLMRAFFAMETENTVEMIKKHNLLDEYGLR